VICFFLLMFSSLADVIVHEIVHSWCGNLVTNLNWEHFWYDRMQLWICFLFCLLPYWEWWWRYGMSWDHSLCPVAAGFVLCCFIFLIPI
jgi:hypothetical protein